MKIFNYIFSSIATFCLSAFYGVIAFAMVIATFATLLFTQILLIPFPAQNKRFQIWLDKKGKGARSAV